MTQVSRRVITGAATAAGLSLPLLAACGDDAEPDTAADPATGEATPTGDAPSGGEGALTSTADIEVGGGSIFADAQVVVTQPTDGDFKAFTSTCTHQGCQVASVSGGSINCPCHGSKFSITDGSVLGGPATSPLSEIAITVDGDSISLA
ncbi:Rieske (2Fe-2S) protein [Nocardioides sp.]|uniref:Rieske (2Fe-2S) protein n=1 Tax=Nocardioides sp. TaxID=35761 RepID=UPI00356A20BB